MKPVGNLPGLGPLYAVKLAIPAYENLRGRTGATQDDNTGPLHKDIPLWVFVGREPHSNTFAMVFTTDPWWMKKEYAGLCEIAGVRNKTGSDDSTG